MKRVRTMVGAVGYLWWGLFLLMWGVLFFGLVGQAVMSNRLAILVTGGVVGAWAERHFMRRAPRVNV